MAFVVIRGEEGLVRPVQLVQGAVLLALLCSVGCSSNNKGKIEGTKWTSVAATIQGKQRAEGELTLEVGDNNKVVYKVGPRTVTGTYSLGSGDKVTLNLDKELGARKEHAVKIRVEGDTLQMKEMEGTEITFKKI